MADNTIKTGWRTPNPHRPPHHDNDGKPKGGMPNLPVIPAIRFFDNVSYIGDQFVGCFAVETSEGLVLIDSLFPGERYEKIIENGLSDLGYSGDDVKAVLVTHGHSDHYGCAGYLQKKYGSKVYMSARDEDFAKDRSQFSPFGYMEFDADGHLSDGEQFTLGDTTIEAVSTPGHTPGCLSFLIPVYDEGRKHTAALWGGTGLPRDREMLSVYRDSCKKFTSVCDERNVDVEIATHPFVDNSVERFEVVRNIFDGVANPYVIGRNACRRYEDMFLNMALKALNK
ncbi:MBL fold metallo-hydrolase [uncultured Ellagibacter sp.]|uniref:MBL fold metallo-hydrolase n=1 Tax=uncultured Ellagibacter sp. TaxID=2137580 RepID=UPI0026383609|nr:MBL fold metallo-hydrolase [uncultured Ellagibacter sp.]